MIGPDVVVAFVSVSMALLVLATLLPLSRHPHWIVRSMDFPRLQLACLAVGLVGLQLVTLDGSRPLSWILIGATAACLAWQLAWILPYTRLWPVEVATARRDDPDRRIGILTANVLTTNREAPALLELIRRHQPDVVVTLETDAWWETRLDALLTDWPYAIKCPLDNLYGMHVYSKRPLVDAETEFLVEDDKPSMHALLELECGARVRMHFLHPAPPSPTENPESAERDAELVMVARSVAGSDQPVIVTGDLNDVAWSATTRLFRKLSGLLDPRVGRGLFNTFHADYAFARWPLDHLFASAHFTLARLERLPPFGSDHFALLTVLVYDPPETPDGEGLDATEKDHDWADEVGAEQSATAEDVPKPG